MVNPVHQPHVVLKVQGAEQVELHSSTFEALATQSESFACLQRHGRAALKDLGKDVDRLLDEDEDPPSTPRAWRFIQTDHVYLGPAYFAVYGRAVVSTCDQSTVHVTDAGFEMGNGGKTDTHFMAVETTKTRTALILKDGNESGPLDADQIALAQNLSGGNPYVTAVPASFSLAAQQTLYRLRARLMQGKGESVLLSR